jgi:hypothetical protein
VVGQREKLVANTGFAASRAGQSLHRLQINMLLQFGQEGTLIRLQNLNFNSKTTIICGPGRTECYFPACGKPGSLATILLAVGFFG